MTWFGSDVSMKKGSQLDPFGWLRTGTRKVAFEYSGRYDQGLLVWEHNLSGTGSVTFDSLTGGNTLSTGGTASGAKAIRQTHEYHLYLPGRGRLAVAGFIFGTAATNLRRRVGLFESNNGYFLEQTSTGLRFTTRSDVSGSVVDTATEQASWSIDPFDGTGPSGVTIDFTKALALIIDNVGYNAAKTRFGFLIDGHIQYAHEINNLNALTSFAIGTSDLPLRYEIENTGVTSGTNTMKASSCVVYDEDGGSTELGYQFSANNGTTSKSITTRAPVMSIRPKTTFGGLTNRAHVHLKSFELLVKTNDMLYEIVRNGSLTGSSFASVAGDSVTNFDTAATAISGGIVLGSGYVASGFGAGANGSILDFVGRLSLTNDFAGTTTDILTIVATSMTGTSAVTASMTWEEQR